MSWLARSLVNSFRGDEDQDSQHNPSIKPGNVERSGVQNNTDDELASPSRSVKEDLSELTKTITRQFWGVASFLAPPPEIPHSDRNRAHDSSDSVIVERSEELELPKSPRMAGIRNDFAELGGRFRSGISILSNTKAVSEISKIASTFLPFADVDEEDDDGELAGVPVGITEDVLLFVSNISMHPETWLDFPLIAEDEDPDDFEMSDVQQEHALAVERLEPRLAALRIELCPSHMSEGCFWKIYFVLLHSRLNEHDVDLLSTPQIVQARTFLLSDLQNRAKPKTEKPAIYFPSGKVEDQHKPTPIVIETFDEMKKHSAEIIEVEINDKTADEKGPPVQPKRNDLQTDVLSASKQKDEGEDDDWLKDEAGETSNSIENAVSLGNEEEVSFSDLEEEDDCPTRTEIKVNSNHDDWLNVDEIDVE